MADLRWPVIRLTTLFLVLTLCQSVFAENVLKSIHENNKGVASLELEDAAAAEQHFIQALAENPFNVLVHLNLGRTFEIQKMFDKAIKENESVLRYNGLPKELQYVAHFNAGNAAAQGEKVDLAVQHYKEALEVTPDYLETKTNIELLFKSGAGKGKGKEGKGKDKGEGEGEGGQGEQPQEPQSNQDQKEKKK